MQDLRPVHLTVSTWAASSTLSDLFFIRHSYCPAGKLKLIVSASSSPVPAVLLYSYAVQADVPTLRHSIDNVTVLSSYLPLPLRYPSPAGKSISTSYSEAVAPIGQARYGPAYSFASAASAFSWYDTVRASSATPSYHEFAPQKPDHGISLSVSGSIRLTV